MNAGDRKYLDAKMDPLQKSVDHLVQQVDKLIPTVASHGTTISNLKVAIGMIGGLAALGMLALTLAKHLHL